MSGGSVTSTAPWGEITGGGGVNLGGIQGVGQQPFLQAGFGRAAELLKQGPPSYYGQPTLAGFTQPEQQAMADVIGYTQGQRPARMQKSAEDALNTGLGGQVDYNAGPFGQFRGALEENVLSSLNRPETGMLPKLRENLVNYQQGGSSRGNMLQQQAISEAVTKGMTGPLAKSYMDAYSGAQERVPQFMQQYPSIMGAPLENMAAMGGVGEEQRAMNQAQMDRSMAEYQYETTAPQQALQQYLGNIAGQYGATQQTTPSAMGQMGNLAQLAMAAKFLMPRTPTG
jgi:hypothetical protein